MEEKFTEIELMTIAVALFNLEMDVKKSPLPSAEKVDISKIRALRHKTERMFGFDFEERGEEE